MCDSIYVVMAYDQDKERIRECIPVSTLEKAMEIRDILIPTYGGANVAFASRKVDAIPQNIIEAIEEAKMPPKEKKTWTGPYIAGGRWA